MGARSCIVIAIAIALADGRPPAFSRPAGTDWAEVGELVIESCCVQAPKRLGARVRLAG